MLVFKAPPLELAAEPPGAAFPAGGWKRGLIRILAYLLPSSPAIPPGNIIP
ncbi:hypothetical protein [Nostoc sp.]|uniref:hypothetical protein n=1 Tax=Nostoc sp. TaxID=1180 RepID=UPI002FF8F73D